MHSQSLERIIHEIIEPFRVPRRGHTTNSLWVLSHGFVQILHSFLGIELSENVDYSDEVNLLAIGGLDSTIANLVELLV